MQIKAVDFASYAVSNVKKSVKFYRDILGLKLTSEGESWAEFDVGNVALVIGNWGKVTKGNGTGIALAVDDIEATIKELKKKKVKISGEPWDTPVCHGASLKDPDGNTIYLHKRKDGTCG